MAKTLSLAAALALVLACISANLYAQVTPPRVPEASPKLNLSMEQRYVIRENIKDMKIEPAPGDLHLAVGDHVPPDVNLQPIPSAVAQKVPQVKAHKFFVAGGQIVLVDPQANTVAETVKLAND